MRRGHPDAPVAHPPSGMASGQDTKTTIGPGYQGLPLRSPRPYPVTCHPSPKQLEDILKEGPMTKRCRKIEQGCLFMERKRMHILDTQSCGRREHERRSDARTGTLSTGQSVFHWWAGWFKSATEPPMQLRKKLRPAWFDATIIMALGFRNVTYAGRQWREPCYQVH